MIAVALDIQRGADSGALCIQVEVEWICGTSQSGGLYSSRRIATWVGDGGASGAVCASGRVRTSVMADRLGANC